MPTKNLQQNSQSIPFWRRRWFWAAVMGVGVVSIIYFYFYRLHIPLSIQNVQELFMLIPVGFITDITFASFGLLDLFINPSFTSVKFIFLFFIYYLLLTLLLYQSFKDRKVKIRYPISFIIILALSIGGYYFLLKVAENF